MNIRITACTLLLCCSGLFAKGMAKEKVEIIDNIPTTSSYIWWVEGKSGISCTGSSCTSYFMPAGLGVSNVNGAILKIKRSDGTIAIAECVAKERVGADVATTLSGVNASKTYRSCRIPEANSSEQIDAEFHLNTVKLYFQNPSTDNSGKIYSETYLVKGTLHPAVSRDVARVAEFERERDGREITCGPEKSKIVVHRDKNHHPTADTDSSHATVYIIQQDEFHAYVIGAFPTRYALDGQWFGGNSDNSYFYTSIDPGEHHMCAEWGVDFKHYARPFSLAKINLKSGETYYFRARVVLYSVGGQGERSITLDPISAEEGKRLISEVAYSTAKIK